MIIEEGTAWPPAEVKHVYEDIEAYDAWYSGDPARLMKVNRGKAMPRRFWGAPRRLERRTVHVPIAADISQISADLLFSEHPKITVQDKRLQERLDAIIESDGLIAKLVEAAEIAAALGGVFLKVDWDRQLADHPILNIVQPDQVIPTFRHGMLAEAIVWSVVEEQSGRVFRLLEKHTPGHILTELYEGTSYQVGEPVPLAAMPQTEDIPPEVNTGIDALLCVYVPNRRPNRQRRGTRYGMSDLHGTDSMMDALDETATSLMRDIWAGLSRVMMPESMLEYDVQLKQAYVDLEEALFVPVSASETTDPLSQQITVSQFTIRTEEHINASLHWIERIVSAAGYSPQSFGLSIEGRADSAAALKVRERKSFTTAARKAEYWRPAVQRVLWLMLMVDQLQFSGSVVAEVPNVEIQDSVIEDLRERSASIEMLSRARALSIRTAIRLLHPDWGGDQVEAEALDIMQENGILVGDTVSDLV